MAGTVATLVFFAIPNLLALEWAGASTMDDEFAEALTGWT